MSLFDRRRLLGLLAAGALAPGALRAQPAARPPVSFPLFDAPPPSHALSRFDLTLGDRSYRLFRALPTAPAPAAGRPSLWMLDGNAVFSRLTADLLAAHPGLAVVGIGYPVETAHDSLARSLDYTPPAPGSAEAARRPIGEDAAFRARLLGPLFAAGAEGAELDPGVRSLWGHSYGGLFTLSTLFAEPDAFAGWIAVSPSTGFGGGALEKLEAAARPVSHGKAKALILLGDSELRRGAAEPEGGRRPSPSTMAMAGRLAARPDLDLRLRVLEGLGHGATFAASFPEALALAAAGRG